jgi:hypothetical protein
VHFGKPVECQDVGLDTDEHVRRVGESLGKLVDNAGVLDVYLLGMGLVEDRAGAPEHDEYQHPLG